ncbi:MAG: radical SAM protein [Ignavibacteriales bacterium]|nr:radical SAM protein [Ignavibacteriales bacterium]
MLILCNYYVTYRCNANCSFCNLGGNAKTPGVPRASLEDFKRNIDELTAMGLRFVDLTGGEPLLHPQIGEMAGYAQSKGAVTVVVTNTLLYPKRAEELAGNVDLLRFSLDSSVREEHDAIRGVKCFDKVMESIEIARSLGEYPDLLFTATDENASRLPEVYEIARRHDLALIVNPVFSYFGNSKLSQSSLDVLQEFTEGREGVYVNDGFLDLRREGGNDVEQSYCKAVSSVVVISPNNEILLPCFHHAKARLAIDRPLAELMESETVQNYKERQGTFDFCKGCDINCYFEPSFALPLNRFGRKGVRNKVGYGFLKFVRQPRERIRMGFSR